jgi:hypothetical protein
MPPNDAPDKKAQLRAKVLRLWSEQLQEEVHEAERIHERIKRMANTRSSPVNKSPKDGS